MALRAQEISQEAGSKIAAAMKDVIGAAAGLSSFAMESARDLVQYMVRRGQMAQEEADRLIREVEEAHGRQKPMAPKAAATKPAAAAKPVATTRPSVAAPAVARPAAHQPAPAKAAPAKPSPKPATPAAPAKSAKPAKPTAKRAAKPAAKPTAKKSSPAKPAHGKAAAKAAGKKKKK